MKNLFSLTLVACAALVMACGGNANRPAATEVAEEVVEVTVDECCAGETEECCAEGECAEKCEEAPAEA